MTTQPDLLAVVLAELDRIEALDTVQDDDGYANRFSVGARWTIRMVREAIDRGAPAHSDTEHFDAKVLAELAGTSTDGLKAILARLGVDLRHCGDQLLIDRAGLQHLRDAAATAGFADLAAVLQQALNAGGRRRP